MFICLFDNDTVAIVEDVYCDIGNLKTGYLYDENGKKIIKHGIVIDILQFYDDWD